MNWFLLTISSLAVFRIAELIAVDVGPFHIFKWLRAWSARQNKILSELFSCPYCVGAHAAGWIAFGLWKLGHIPLDLAPLWWFGIAGGAVAIMRAVRERK